MSMLETIKNKEQRIIFLKKYKVIPIVLAVISTFVLALIKVDYTEDINKNKVKINNLTIKLEDKQKEINDEVNSQFSKEEEGLESEIEKLNFELTALKKEKSEVDKKVTEKKNREEAAKKKEEDEKKKGKWAIQSDGYNVWEAYFTSGTYQISVTHKGGGNCILWAGERSNQKQNLIINKIGAGTYAGTFKISKAGYYTLTFKTDSAFTFEYKGF